MKKSDYKKGEVVELDEINIILNIPSNAARLDVTAYLLDDDGKTVKVQSVLNTEEIRKCRSDFLENVDGGDDYNARFVITEAGKKWLEDIERGDQDACRQLDELVQIIQDGD